MKWNITTKSGRFIEIELFEFYGWKNRNTAVANFYTSKGNIEAGMEILPLIFWNNFEITRDKFPPSSTERVSRNQFRIRKTARSCIFLWLGGIFWDRHV
jgi:hypothetical protein